MPSGPDIGQLLFDTPVGRCGLAWRGSAIAALQLPEADDAATRRRLRARLGPAEDGTLATAPTNTTIETPVGTAARREADAAALPPADVDLAGVPAWVRDVVAQIGALLDGAPQRLADVPLDFRDVPAFARRVYALSRTLPPGRTLTYGELAHRLGEPGAARAVGQALGSNPFAIIVPCHRVMAAGARSGGFSAHGGLRTKLALLALESRHQPAPDDDLFGWAT